MLREFPFPNGKGQGHSGGPAPDFNGIPYEASKGTTHIVYAITGFLSRPKGTEDSLNARAGGQILGKKHCGCFLVLVDSTNQKLTIPASSCRKSPTVRTFAILRCAHFLGSTPKEGAERHS